jgi:long-chain acyl-CoA synthetase
MILFDELDPPLLKEVASKGIKMFPIKDVIDRKITRPLPSLKLDDHFSYCFTSGTTGLPKGVIMTHRNFVSQFYSSKLELPFTNKDVHLSYLPLQHAFEHVVIYMILFCGAHIRFYSGVVTDLPKDLARVKPTVLPIVPRLLNMFYSMLKPFGHVDKALA